MKNLYKILNINNAATGEEIISAFRKQAKLNHPDISNHSNANEIIQGIYEAREILLDSNKRKQYDLLLSSNKDNENDYNNIFEDSIKSAAFDASKFISRSFNFIKLLFFFPFYIYQLFATVFVGGFLSICLIMSGFYHLPIGILFTAIGIIFGRQVIIQTIEISQMLIERFIYEFKL